jgi:hypothetical protein
MVLGEGEKLVLSECVPETELPNFERLRTGSASVNMHVIPRIRATERQ